MKQSLFLPAAALVCALAACGTVTSTWPLRHGSSLASVSLGGPVTNVGGVQLPVPYPVARYRYGITDNVGVYAGIHPLMAGFGVAAGDAGATWHFLGQRGLRPCIGVGAGAIGMVKPADGGTAFFPTAEATASWRRRGRSITYLGVHTLFELAPIPHFTYAPFVGHETRISRPMSFNLEVKWYGAYERTKPRAVTYTLPIANHGALGFAGGINYHFRGWYE